MKSAPLPHRAKRSRPRHRPTLRSIGLQLGVLLSLHLGLVEFCARVSPHETATGRAFTGALVLLRVFLLVFGAGWLAARLWLWFSHPDFGLKPRRAARAR